MISVRASANTSSHCIADPSTLVPGATPMLAYVPAAHMHARLVRGEVGACVGGVQQCCRSVAKLLALKWSGVCPTVYGRAQVAAASN